MKWLFLVLPFLAVSLQAATPNVIVMMTDDQGIGDFGVTGNKLIETPNIDEFAAQSGSLSTFYVSPVCSPTRASLMTGRWNQRTRCIDTWLGRSMMDAEEVTIAEVLRDHGYATGCFGKWHLGDCYPMRAMDQGFEETLVHRGGGLAQPSEPLENGRRYTDPILFRNGEQVQTQGFCTDVYFDAALEFIEKQSRAKKPFFIYLPTNAPHGPYHDVPADLLAHYQAKDLSPLFIQEPRNAERKKMAQDQLARIAAMITNEDQNVGRLMKRLGELGIDENTMVIRLNDNGPNSLRYVGELRGMKSHVHEGGVRSPCWVRWPAGIKAGATSNVISAHIDLLPTIVEACGAKPSGAELDGRSFLPFLTGKAEWAKPRPVVIQSHRGNEAIRYHHFMLRHGDWKLLHASGFGKESFEGEPKFELYDLESDPGEANNLAEARPEILKRLKGEYNRWFDDVSTTRPDNYGPATILVGTPHENPTVLTRQDWRGSSWGRGSKGQWILQSEKDGFADLRVVLDPQSLPEKETTFTIRAGAFETIRTLSAGATEVTLKRVPIQKGPLTIAGSLGQEEFGFYQVELKFLAED